MAIFVLLDDWEGRIRSSSGFAALRAALQNCTGGDGSLIILDEPLASLTGDALASLSSVRYCLAMRERTKLDAATLDKLPSLELLLQTGGHAYHVDAKALATRGIATALGRRAQRVLHSVPELTIMFMLACAHRLGEAVRAMSAPLAAATLTGGAAAPTGWPSLVGRSLSGRTLGILGMGRHGQAVARLATAFGMKVVTWDRSAAATESSATTSAAGHTTAASAGGAASGSSTVIPYSKLPLDNLLSACDVVSIHLRLSPESRGLLSAEKLALMRPGACLINTARGAIIDEAALIAALQSGALSSAGLDVFTEEPLAPDSPLRSCPGAVLTPHIGWHTEEVFEEFAAIAAEQLAAYLSPAGLSRTELMDAAVELRHGASGRLV